MTETKSPPLPKASVTPIAPTTTIQEDLTVAGQRRINLIWEITQSVITVMITAAAIYCAVYKIEAQIINFAFVAIVSTYYTRTNHQAIGGVGAKPTQPYEGR